MYDRLWGSGFLPSKYQGVKLRAGAEPVLYHSDPPGVSTQMRRRLLDDLAQLNQGRHFRLTDVHGNVLRRMLA